MLKIIFAIIAISLILVPISMPMDIHSENVSIGFGKNPVINTTYNGTNITVDMFQTGVGFPVENMGLLHHFENIKWKLKKDGPLNYSYSSSFSAYSLNQNIFNNNFPSKMPFSGIMDHYNITINVTRETKTLNLTQQINNSTQDRTNISLTHYNTLQISYTINIQSNSDREQYMAIPITVFTGKGIMGEFHRDFFEKKDKMKIYALQLSTDQNGINYMFSLGPQYSVNGTGQNGTISYFHESHNFYAYFLLMKYNGTDVNIKYDPYLTLPTSNPLKAPIVITPITQAIAEVENNVYAFAGGTVIGILLIVSGYVSHRRRYK